MESLNVTITTIDSKSFTFTGEPDAKVDELRQWTMQKMEKEDCDCNLFFRGRLLRDGSLLTDNGVGDQAIVRATFQTTVAPKPPLTPSMISYRIQMLMMNFRSCMNSLGPPGTPRLDNLFKMLSETLRTVSEEDKDNLADDRVAFLMAQDPKLHRALLHKPQYITRALVQYPALLDALSSALSSVSQSLTASPPQAPGGEQSIEGNLPVHYGMDYLMVDDQAEDEAEEGEEGEEGDMDDEAEDGRSRYPASAPLSSDQLTTAISSAMQQLESAARGATATAQRSAAPPVSSSSSSSSQMATQRRIDATDLQAALNFFATPPNPTPPTASTAAATALPGATNTAGDPLTEKVRALAELGFTDAAAARRALEIANGNVEMAVDILLG